MSANDERWIIVRNWDRFQHYKDRDPPWIKLYSELNSDPNWLGLTLAERGLLVTIWIEFGRSRGMVQAKSPIFAGTFARPSQFRSLSDAGFIAIVASKPLAIARSREAEKEVKDKGLPAMPAVARPQQAGRQSYPQPLEPVEDRAIR